MTKSKYSGTGQTLDTAMADLTKNAKAAGYEGTPTEVMYKVSVLKKGKSISGKPNSVYELAVASAVHKAKVNPDRLKPSALEVSVSGTFTGTAKARPSPGAPIDQLASTSSKYF